MAEQVKTGNSEAIMDLQAMVAEGRGEELAAMLSRYPKYESVVMMAAAGLPVSKGMVITSGEAKNEAECQKILAGWGVKETTVRTDRVGGAVDAPSVQGCPVGEVWAEAKKFLGKGLLPMVIAGGDIFHNTYSVNVVVDSRNQDSVSLEIVGPGFCATDTNKRDVVHERGILVGAGGRESFQDNQTVRQEVYEQQVALLKETLIKKENKSREQKFVDAEEARAWVEQFLKGKEALVLSNPSYREIPSRYLEKVWAFVPGMREAGKRLGFANKPFIVSMSFVKEADGEHPYFWDIHPYGGYKEPEKAKAPETGVEELRKRYSRQGD